MAAEGVIARVDPEWEFLVWDLYAYTPQTRYVALAAPVAWRDGVLWVSLAEADWQTMGSELTRKADAYGWRLERMLP